MDILGGLEVKQSVSGDKHAETSEVKLEFIDCGTWKSGQEEEENKHSVEPCVRFEDISTEWNMSREDDKQNLQKMLQWDENSYHCESMTENQEELTTQLNRNREESYICIHCNIHVLGKEYYPKHVRRCKRKYLRLEDASMEMQRIYKCSECSYIAKWKCNLQRHMQLHIREEDEMKKYKCDKCEYTTANKGDLKSHTLRQHIDKKIKRYKCQICTYTTYSKGQLTPHIRIHTNEKPYKCTYKKCKCTQPCECKPCEYKAARQSCLNSHILHRHSETEKKFQCRDCNYSTHKRGSLVIHERIHSNEKPFMCMYQDCNYETISRQQLQSHIANCHSQKRPFKCDKCGYTAKTNSNLTAHIKRKHA